MRNCCVFNAVFAGVSHHVAATGDAARKGIINGAVNAFRQDEWTIHEQVGYNCAYIGHCGSTSIVATTYFEPAGQPQAGYEGVYNATFAFGKGGAEIAVDFVTGKAIARVGLLGVQVAAVDDLQAAANRAAAGVGPGSGAVHGTHVHTAFAEEIGLLGRSDISSEVSYLGGQLVNYGTRSSVRLDAVVGTPTRPTAIFDLKTGSAGLTTSRIDQIRDHLPEGFQYIPVSELRPQ